MALLKLFLNAVTRAFSPSVPNAKSLPKLGFSDFRVPLKTEYVSVVFF